MVIMMMGAKVSASPPPTPPPRGGGCFDFDPISPQSLWRRVASLSGGEWRVASGEWGEWPGRMASSGERPEWRVARVRGEWRLGLAAASGESRGGSECGSESG